MTWALNALTANPGIQERLRKEIENTGPPSQKPTYEEIESMRYLNNFIREVLRFYPPGKLDDLCEF